MGGDPAGSRRRRKRRGGSASCSTTGKDGAADERGGRGAGGRKGSGAQGDGGDRRGGGRSGECSSEWALQRDHLLREPCAREASGARARNRSYERQ